MIRLDVQIRDQRVAEIAGPAGNAKARRGLMHGIRKSLAVMEEWHKNVEFIRRAEGGMRLSENTGRRQPADPNKITSRTGNLKRSYTRRIDNAAMMGSYGSDSIVALWMQEGTKAHDIYPKALDQWGGYRMGAFLRFPGGATFTRSGKYKSTVWTFARHVHHPGTKPRDTLGRTIDHTSGTINRILADAAREGLDGA